MHGKDEEVITFVINAFTIDAFAMEASATTMA